jgi:hypothetical protein
VYAVCARSRVRAAAAAFFDLHTQQTHHLQTPLQPPQRNDIIGLVLGSLLTVAGAGLTGLFGCKVCVGGRTEGGGGAPLWGGGGVCSLRARIFTGNHPSHLTKTIPLLPLLLRKQVHKNRTGKK